MTTLPVFGDGPLAGKSAGNSFHNWVIPKDASNPDLGFAYIKVATDSTAGAQLASMVGSPPANKEALASLSKNKDLSDGLSQIEKAMAEGNPEEALKSLDQLASALESTIQALKKQQGQAGESFPELAEKMR